MTLGIGVSDRSVDALLVPLSMALWIYSGRAGDSENFSLNELVPKGALLATLLDAILIWDSRAVLRSLGGATPVEPPVIGRQKFE